MTKAQLEKKYNIQIHDDTAGWVRPKKVGVIAYKDTGDYYNMPEVCRAKNLAELAEKLAVSDLQEVSK